MIKQLILGLLPMSDDFVVYHQARDQPYSEEFVVHSAGGSDKETPEQACGAVSEGISFGWDWLVHLNLFNIQ